MGDLFTFEDVVVRGDEGVPILDHLSATIPDGGITAITGPSGSGKSTLLRLCNHLEVPVEGRVLFRGEDLAGIDPLQLRRTVGMVFQRPALFPGTVRDNLRVGRPDAPEDDLAAALEVADLPAAFLDRVADEVSGGEAQRVALARALVVFPEVLLLDEPTASLDPDATQALEHVARRAAEAGMPQVWVTHDLAQAERLADHRLEVKAGRVVGQA